MQTVSSTRAASASTSRCRRFRSGPGARSASGRTARSAHFRRSAARCAWTSTSAVGCRIRRRRETGGMRIRRVTRLGSEHGSRIRSRSRSGPGRIGRSGPGRPGRPGSSLWDLLGDSRVEMRYPDAVLDLPRRGWRPLFPRGADATEAREVFAAPHGEVSDAWALVFVGDADGVRTVGAHPGPHRVHRCRAARRVGLELRWAGEHTCRAGALPGVTIELVNTADTTWVNEAGEPHDRPRLDSRRERPADRAGIVLVLGCAETARHCAR